MRFVALDFFFCLVEITRWNRRLESLDWLCIFCSEHLIHFNILVSHSMAVIIKKCSDFLFFFFCLVLFWRTSYKYSCIT